jgi:archaemetzincin
LTITIPSREAMETLLLSRTAEVEDEVFLHLERHLGETCAGRLEVQRSGLFELYPEEFHRRRRQYLATLVLSRLRPLKASSEYLLGITAADLYARGLNFVFGEADPTIRCALVSLARLGPAPGGGGRATFLIRALTEAAHETGHLLLLPHCPDPGCVMHFSNSLADTDRKGPAFCDSCRRRLTSAYPREKG